MKLSVDLKIKWLQLFGLWLGYSKIGCNCWIFSCSATTGADFNTSIKMAPCLAKSLLPILCKKIALNSSTLQFRWCIWLNHWSITSWQNIPQEDTRCTIKLWSIVLYYIHFIHHHLVSCLFIIIMYCTTKDLSFWWYMIFVHNWLLRYDETPDLSFSLLFKAFPSNRSPEQKIQCLYRGFSRVFWLFQKLAYLGLFFHSKKELLFSLTNRFSQTTGYKPSLHFVRLTK